MAIDVDWQDENGATLARYNGPQICMSLVGAAPIGARCLCFIDPYGDTTFNSAQVSVLETELASVATADGVASDQARGLLQFVHSRQDRPHMYLKFIGD